MASGSRAGGTVNYSIADMGMVGLRDVLVVAPAASFHHHHHQQPQSLLPSADDHHHQHHLPVIPLLSSAACLGDDDRRSGPGTAGIQFWQPQPSSQHYHHHHLNTPNPNPSSSTFSYLKKPVPMLDASGIVGGYSTCQDCGNQAKKDCTHRRCRTCCKSRGFDCSTHVKSTWVPAARRRERQQFSTSAAAAAAAAAAGSSTSTSAPKKPRLISSHTTTTTSTSNTTPRSVDTTSSHQDASFRESLPGHVRAPAVFKCVRVTSIEDGEDEYAYQAMVRIGGHTFKGFLYDQGDDDGRRGDGDEHTLIAATGDGNNNTNIPNISELHLGGAGVSGAAGPSDVYGGGTGGFLGGGGTTNYGNPIN